MSGVRVPPPASEKPCKAGLSRSRTFDRIANLCPNCVPEGPENVPTAPIIGRDQGPDPGHVYRRSRAARADAWCAKYRLPDGRQVTEAIGPAWTQRGRPAAGYFTKRTAEAWLRDVLDEARRGTLPGMVRTGATFADAAAEYLRWHRARPRAQAVDAARLPLDHQGAPPPRLRRHARSRTSRPTASSAGPPG